MGRRKKEPESAHRETISSAAERLFSKKGIKGTTMAEIATEAGYSKASLYVYFASKEEIVSFLVLKSMRLLHSYLLDAVAEPATTREKYNRICKALTQYQAQYPLYFTMALGEMNVDFEQHSYLPMEKETYEVGEQINEKIIEFVQSGIDQGDLMPDISILPTSFLLWASLSGVIQMAVNKASYIQISMQQSKEQFMEFCFDRLYGLIAAKHQRRGDFFMDSDRIPLEGKK